MADTGPVTTRVSTVAAIMLAMACFVLPPTVYGVVAYDGLVAETFRSARPLLINLGLLSLFSLALAFGSYVTLRVIPMRKILRINDTLRQRDAKLAFANTILTAVTEGSQNAILVIDEHIHIFSYNKNFVDLWNIPAALLETGVDRPVLKTVLTQVRDPEAFLERVEYLFANPAEEGTDRIELLNGRLIDRHTSSLYGERHDYLGRIWFFRDVTEREEAANALLQRDALLHATAISATELLTAPRLDDAIRKSLEMVSKTMQIDRMAVLERSETGDGVPIPRYIWQSPVSFRPPCSSPAPAPHRSQSMRRRVPPAWSSLAIRSTSS